jgi:hypothetical protein
VSWRQLNYTFCENETAIVELNASTPFTGRQSIPTMTRQIDGVFARLHPNLSNFRPIGIGLSTVDFSGVTYRVANEGD